jgi:subtilisin
VVGVAPQVSLYIAKALDASGVGSTSNLVAALDAATRNGVDVVNMSLGSPFSSKTLQSACNRANNAGVLLVAAAGNEALSILDVPARYTSVVSVGAIDAGNQRATFSNYSKNLTLCAPGVGVLSTMPTYPVTLTGALYGYQMYYDGLSGTSMACPHVVGVAALVMAAHPTWTNVQVRQQLTATATDLGAPGRDKYYGYGLVNAAAAVN